MPIQFDASSKKLIIHKSKEVLIEIDASKEDFDFYTEDVDWVIASQIFQADIADIPNGLRFSTEMESTVFNLADWIEFTKKNDSFAKIAITFRWEHWDKPVTVHKFLEAYKSDMEILGYECLVNIEDDLAYLSIKCPIKEGKVQSSLDNVINLAKQRYHFLVSQFHKIDSSRILLKVFDFPQEYEVACVQYIIWFGEFLGSLDIDITVSTEKIDGITNVLVSPVDAPELLETIEKLFTQYLALPYIDYLPVSNVQISAIDKANALQLVNQIENFKNQIQMKNAIIELKDVTINQLKSDLKLADNDRVLLKSLIDKPDVEIANSGLSLTSWQWGIFKVEPRKLIKKLMRKA
ncbi:hypothetical protein J2X32_003265 [Rheinheimera pacifica]|uniref:hypothetical protein n=1 Tax=Rheinheimera pacifica TaxID=173990 RepID=UPI00285B246C|nr:hypothetical protein [Rheinheimera pacifica]MDR6984619.1 hypothetical protein [Rheinheimera pacifica]